MKIYAALLALLVAACGDDPPPVNPAPAPAAGAPAAPGAPGAPGVGSGSGKPLPTMRHAEDRVNCPIPRSGSKKCDPKAIRPVSLGGAIVEEKPDDLICKENEVCSNTNEGWLCGPCPERFAIRHEFKDRDFAGETNRDPFQSFVVKVPGSGSGSQADLPKDGSGRCVRNEQLRVSNYGYQDLKLVGIVSQGTQRKVLLMDPGNYGHIIKRGDCVGKEKAWVKEIGENFICFEMSSEAASAARMPEASCVELHTKQLAVTQLPQASSGAPPVTPVLPSTGTQPAPQGPTSTTTITPIQPSRPAPVQPAPTAPTQAPTTIKP
jgi:Tfp pilus assembly protein PilP